MEVYAPEPDPCHPPTWARGAWTSPTVARTLLDLPLPQIHRLIAGGTVRHGKRGGKVVCALDDLWIAARRAAEGGVK